jgi:hypothetical protein
MTSNTRSKASPIAHRKPGRAVPLCLAVAVATLVAMALLAACRPGPRPTLEGARQFADQFMQERLAGQVDAARARLSQKGRAAFEQAGGPALNLAALGDITGAVAVSQAAGTARDSFVITYRIQEVPLEEPHAAFWDEALTVTGSGAAYLIDGVTSGVLTQATVEGSAVVLRTGQAVRTLFAIADLPDAFRPQGAEPGVEFGVGKEGFVLLAFSPLGDRLAFVTWGTHGFLGIVPTAQGGTPAGVDIHYSGLTVDVRWSPDAAHLAAVVDAATGNRALMAYRLEPLARLALGLEAMFSPEDYDLSGPRWLSPSQFTFGVRTADGGTDQRTGQYTADVLTREVRRTGQ